MLYFHLHWYRSCRRRAKRTLAISCLHPARLLMFFAVSTAIKGVGNRHWNHSLVDWEPLRSSEGASTSRGHDSSERCAEQIVAKLSSSGSLPPRRTMRLFRRHLAPCGSLQSAKELYSSNMVSNFQHDVRVMASCNCLLGSYTYYNDGSGTH